ncbi:saccharopine dehydrogenase NADP-binding domain-containing protein [Conexibacter stalactiti]|uniref:Saccharopine dehydrogenase NADP-binding domain-containing protein n=1 Tax=Conexibacter stalactiti TaxID=1940611 RepID=A0ABU4HTB0_9ACTN|nr:saccharopine dehydrogenase NADP-binding domain-containing protein [Conexibacter stalactiti]MDW5596551.1 saccharopine dehydrogenase NADP-binding domain-containing protein [Conexibacter stalactiti]MEC5037193.1 saccharopine dehydrogenase NADP-binding domain-containing protein [Conexibacter stalactiti]
MPVRVTSVASASAATTAGGAPDPTTRVLVVGGSGQVGRTIVAALAPLLPGRVVVAGRGLDRAQQVAAATGHGVTALRLDVADPALATDPPPAAAVVMCIDDRPPGLVAAWLARGTHYVDVTATPARIAEVEALDGVARDGGASALLSVGVAPGLTNLLAASVAGGFDAPPEIELLVQLGLGDVHGPAAVEWTLDGLADPTALRDSRTFALSGRRRPLRAYRFPFPEQEVLPRTLGVASASTWLALDPAPATGLFALAARAGIGRMVARERPRSRAVALRLLAAGGAAPGSDACVLAARARGLRGGRPHERQASLAGRREAELTGLVAAAATRALLGEPLSPPATAASSVSRTGVHHIDQVLEIGAVVASLRAAGARVDHRG